MDDTQLNDLKQFIQATVTQATSDMATKEDIRKVREDLAQIQSAIGDTVSVSNETIDEKIDDHESRISKLEHQST